MWVGLGKSIYCEGCWTPASPGGLRGGAVAPGTLCPSELPLPPLCGVCCLHQLFVDPPFCLVTEVKRSRKKRVSLLPGSSSKNPGHLLHGLACAWLHGAVAVAGVLVLHNSCMWKTLPFNVKNGKDRCGLCLMLFSCLLLSSRSSSPAATFPHSV